MDEQRLLYLIDKWEAGKATPTEEKELKDWYNAFDEVETDNAYIRKISMPGYLKSRYEELLQHVSAQKRRHRAFRVVWKAAAVAAVLIVALAVSWKLYTQQMKISPTLVKTDIAPGHNGAVLTLANGSKVVLDSAGNGTVAQQGNVQVINAKGQLIYNKDNASAVQIAYNTLTTPRARQYKLVLPDGTKVWLNSASSIYYPVAFTGKERVVEITGEAYFQVVHNAAMPFMVKAGNETVKDIGTQFNVNAYAGEEGIKTTLVEGSVFISASVGGGGRLLKPGEQALVNNGITVKQVDVDVATAWKNGYFIFDDEDMESIMRQVARWYNVEVSYGSGVAKNMRFGGIVSRSRNVSAVLALMERTGKVHFKIEGQKIEVLK